MGLYLMLAGTSSENRFKSLEQSFSRDDLKPYLPDAAYKKLTPHYDENDPIYIWGANEGSISQLKGVQEEEYVLDVKNKEVPNVFQFCFWYKTPDTKLQEYIGWDDEKPRDEQRPYRYVYFLKNPQTPSHDTKAFYRKAFGHEGNPYWLMGQRYIDDKQLNKALNRTESSSVEEFLGIRKSAKPKTKNLTSEVTEENSNYHSSRIGTNKKSNPKSFWRAFLEWIKAFPGFGNR